MGKAVLLDSFRQGISKDWRQAEFNSYLLIGLIFSIPFSTSASSILSFLIFIRWLLQTNFRNDWNQLKSNRLVRACFLFLGLHMIGLLWTSDPMHGLVVMKKEWKLLLLPCFMFCVKKEHISHYMSALVLAMAICVMISYGIWLEVIPPINRATVNNPVPFGTHITYNPVLALAIYLLARSLLFDKRTSIIQQGFYLSLLTTMTINMFITGGRSGQVMFFATIVVLGFQYFRGQFFKAGATAVVIVVSTLVMAYSFSDLFRQRLLGAISHQDTSTQQRIAYVASGLKIFLRHPLIGVGTGDLPAELKKTQSYSSSYEVHLIDNSLVYARETCNQEDTAAPFFLHLVPVDERDLPDHRRRYGFDNLDFRFDSYRLVEGNGCAAMRELPGYAIAEIRTGQYVPGEFPIWRVYFDIAGQVAVPASDYLTGLIGDSGPVIRGSEVADVNPHNMYIMEMIQFGTLGLVSLLYIFYVQIRHALGTQHVILRQVGVALPLFFLLVNFGESYLYVHATSLLFTVFSSFLYKEI